MVSEAITRSIYLLLTFSFAGLCAPQALAQANAVAGRALFAEERKGNCSACHKTPTDAPRIGASNIGPPLEAIRQKYPTPADRMRLRDSIRDQSRVNASTIMPPYGKHRILTETEIDDIVAYLETL
ncbi:MAG: sulfur oxidation c-type cytochrome SoxX [Burkholderiales bacterium]|nr:sulfur oxidation c-type cytochrome SoxX [Burkholderiales bacterium]